MKEWRVVFRRGCDGRPFLKPVVLVRAEKRDGAIKEACAIIGKHPSWVEKATVERAKSDGE